MGRVYAVCSILGIALLAGCMHPVSPEQSLEQTELTGSTTVETDAIVGVDSEVCIGEHCFVVEIADTDEKRRIGLMNREALADDAGMLFVFDNMRPFRSFWMKNTLIPLDMLWIDDRQRVVHIEEDVPPCEVENCPTYSPGATESRYVLEINAGLSDQLGITTGMHVQFDLAN